MPNEIKFTMVRCDPVADAITAAAWGWFLVGAWPLVMLATLAGVRDDRNR